ncbi:hypothetical protein Q5752_000150 [Cryptotrichosporon argae]
MRDQLQALLHPVPLALALAVFALGYQTRTLFPPSSVRGLSTSRSLLARKPSSAASASASSAPSASAPTASASAPSAPTPTARPAAPRAPSPSSDGATDPASDSEDEALAVSADLAGVRASMRDDLKLVLVVNDSLGMGKGKIGAQCGHATLACYETLVAGNPKLIRQWRNQGQKKVALRCGTTADLEALAAHARSLNLCARAIQDAGRTQVAPGSKTVLGIGPGPARLIDQVTGKLRLL